MTHQPFTVCIGTIRDPDMTLQSLLQHAPFHLVLVTTVWPRSKILDLLINLGCTVEVAHQKKEGCPKMRAIAFDYCPPDKPTLFVDDDVILGPNIQPLFDGLTDYAWTGPVIREWRPIVGFDINDPDFLARKHGDDMLRFVDTGSTQESVKMNGCAFATYPNRVTADLRHDLANWPHATDDPSRSIGVEDLWLGSKLQERTNKPGAYVTGTWAYHLGTWDPSKYQIDRILSDVTAHAPDDYLRAIRGDFTG